MTDVAIDPATAVPVPKYKVGDVIWRAYTDREQAKHDCPDCLGSKEWTCTTPGGTVMTMPCGRCAGNYRSDEIPSLAYAKVVPLAVPMTIRSLEIRAGSMGSWQKDRVRYFSDFGCVGTTVGEDDVIATKEQAERIAQAKADIANAENAQKPERLLQKHYSALTFRDATFKQARDDVWSAWWCYRHLFEELESILSEENHDRPAEKLDSIREHMDYERRSKVTREFIVAMDALMARALAEFPEEMFADIPSVLTPGRTQAEHDPAQEQPE